MRAVSRFQITRVERRFRVRAPILTEFKKSCKLELRKQVKARERSYASYVASSRSASSSYVRKYRTPTTQSCVLRSLKLSYGVSTLFLMSCGRLIYAP